MGIYTNCEEREREEMVIMPRINYAKIPYEKKSLNTGERVPSNAFYNPNPNYKESRDIYLGYYTYNYLGVMGQNKNSYKEKKAE